MLKTTVNNLAILQSVYTVAQLEAVATKGPLQIHLSFLWEVSQSAWSRS